MRCGQSTRVDSSLGRPSNGDPSSEIASLPAELVNRQMRFNALYTHTTIRDIAENAKHFFINQLLRDLLRCEERAGRNFVAISHASVPMKRSR